MRFTADCRKLITGSKSGSVEVWNPADGTRVISCVGHLGPIKGVASSSDGRRLISGGVDSTVCVWDAEDGKELMRLDGHLYEVNCVDISADGRLGLSGGIDGTVRLWDLEARKELRYFRGHILPVLSVAFPPGGRTAASAGVDRTIRVWSLPVIGGPGEPDGMNGGGSPGNPAVLGHPAAPRVAPPRKVQTRNNQSKATMTDPLQPGSVWSGTRTYPPSAYRGVTVTYFLHIRERNGPNFIGHKFDNGANRNRNEVVGEIQENNVIWHDLRNGTGDPTWVHRGVVQGDQIQFQFAAPNNANPANVGSGTLTLNKENIAPF